MNRYVRPNIAKMAGYVPGEQPRHAKFIKLNTNENPFPPSPKVTEAIRQFSAERLTRYPDPTAASFRTAAADRLGVPPDWILCGNGSDDILTICTRAFVGEGERVRFPTPSYILYRTLAEIQGARWEAVPFRADWGLGDDFGGYGDDLKLAYLPNPNSPSGTWIEPKRVLELAEMLPCPLIVDEAYADFAGDSCVSLVSRCEKILVSRTLSKSYALAGLRFGFLVGQPSMIAELAKVKDSYNCDMISIAAATAAILDGEWLAENVSRVAALRESLADRLGGLGFEVVPSRANFVWCTHSERSPGLLYEGLKERGILVRYMEYEGWGAGLRISVGTPEQQDVLLAMLAEIV